MAQNLSQNSEELLFELVSPEAILASETAQMVIIPGTEGYFAVMAGHAPFLSSLRAGVIEIRQSANDANPRRIFVSGGVSDVNGTVCTVLATDAVEVESLNQQELEQQMQNLQEDIAREKTTDEARKRALEQIEIVKAQIEAITGKPVLS